MPDNEIGVLFVNDQPTFDSNMGDSDWLKFTELKELGGFTKNRKYELVKGTGAGKPAGKVKSKENEIHLYICIGRTTVKAIFYITDKSTGVFGFWCPKSAIVREGEKYVICKSWFEVKIVEFRNDF